MRLFVALVPSDTAIEHLDHFLESRRDSAAKGGKALRWNPVEQLHVTLAFMGEAAEHRVDDLIEGLAATTARRAPYPTAIAGGGAFPDVSRARVVWAGLRLDQPARTELDRLALGARTAAGTAGIAVDGTAFRPHVTVARLGRPGEVSAWVRLLDGYEGPSWSTDTVALVRSHLGEGPRRRPRHETLETFTTGASGHPV